MRGFGFEVNRKSLKRGYYSSSKSGKTPRSKSKNKKYVLQRTHRPSINSLDKLLKATIGTILPSSFSIVNKLAMTQKKLGTEEEEIPQMLTFTAFKSKLIESFKEGKVDA